MVTTLTYTYRKNKRYIPTYMYAYTGYIFTKKIRAYITTGTSHQLLQPSTFTKVEVFTRYIYLIYDVHRKSIGCRFISIYS